jgi:L-amino acid N-acyltransferase YncA
VFICLHLWFRHLKDPTTPTPLNCHYWDLSGSREPPNPASDAFHAALSFIEIGAAVIYDGSKTVRYLARQVT